MLTRKDILKQAFHDCMKEMYAKSQPSGDYDQLIEDFKNGLINKDEHIYDRYYLSQEEFLYIRDKYMEAYGLKEHWVPNIELLEEYLTKGGVKDKYIEAHTDKYGYHPGYRGYENIEPIQDQIQQIIKEEIGNECIECGNKIVDVVMNTIKNCKDFYRFDREASSFATSIALGASPTSNKDTVIKYWKTQGKNVKIIERNPLLFWEMDNYGNEFEEIMEDEYGKNWREYWNNKWKNKTNDL